MTSWQMTSMCRCCSSWAECSSPTLMTSMTTTGEKAALELRHWTSTLTTSAPRRLPCHLAAGLVGTWRVRSGTTPSANNTTVTILVRSPSYDAVTRRKFNARHKSCWPYVGYLPTVCQKNMWLDIKLLLWILVVFKHVFYKMFTLVLLFNYDSDCTWKRLSRQFDVL